MIHLQSRPLAINHILKCDECSYMAISRTVLKHRKTMKHPNKEEPEALGKAEVVRVNNQNHSMTKLS
jgi:hypothetical protein